MYYEINVSLNGQHYFATADRSIRTKEQAENIFNHFKILFPAVDGYRMRVTKWESTGKEVFQNQ